MRRRAVGGVFPLIKTESTFGTEPSGPADLSLLVRTPPTLKLEDLPGLDLQARAPATLKLDKGIPLPKANPRNVVKNTLILMAPGDSFKCDGASLSNIYKWAQRLRYKLRAKLLSGEARMSGSVYRVWRIS